MLLASPSQFKRVSNDAIAGAACEDGFLNRRIELGVAVQASTDLGVLAFTIFTDNNEINISDLASAERTCDSF